MINVEHTYSHLCDLTLKAHQEKFNHPLPLRIQHYDDCYGLPYKVITKRGVNFVGGGLKTSSNHDVGTLYEFECGDVSQEILEDVIYVGHISSICWGHTITDSIARLWWIINDAEKNKYAHFPICYFSETPLSNNYLEFIRLLGVPTNNLYRISQITHFNSVYVPDVCFDNHSVSLKFSNEYVNLINNVINRCSYCATPQRIFLARENSCRQVCSNDIKLILEKKGYVVIYPDKLSVSSQICLFQNAESIVAEESSISHNFIFCKEGTKVIILRKANTINMYQALINQLRKLDVVYIDCHLSICLEQPHRGPFFLYANDNFCNYFQKKMPTFPYKEFKSYLQNKFGVNILPHTYRIDSNYKDIIQKIVANTK